MLVLSRKCGEKIVIPQQNITLTVLEIRGDRIRLGITAPPDVPVHRQEIWQRIRATEPPVEADEPATIGPPS
jgi:carbon storage regulator